MLPHTVRQSGRQQPSCRARHWFKDGTAQECELKDLLHSLVATVNAQGAELALFRARMDAAAPHALASVLGVSDSAPGSVIGGEELLALIHGHPAIRFESVLLESDPSA